MFRIQYAACLAGLLLRERRGVCCERAGVWPSRVPPAGPPWQADPAGDASHASR